MWSWLQPLCSPQAVDFASSRDSLFVAIRILPGKSCVYSVDENWNQKIVLPSRIEVGLVPDVDSRHHNVSKQTIKSISIVEFMRSRGHFSIVSAAPFPLCLKSRSKIQQHPFVTFLFSNSEFKIQFSRSARKRTRPPKSFKMPKMAPAFDFSSMQGKMSRECLFSMTNFDFFEWTQQSGNLKPFTKIETLTLNPKRHAFHQIRFQEKYSAALNFVNPIPILTLSLLRVYR